MGRRRNGLRVVVALVLFAGWAAANLVPLGLAAVSPGLPFEVGPRLHVAAPHDHPTKELLLFLTVRIRRRISLIDAIVGWVQGPTDVFHEKTLFGDETPTESRDRSQGEIDDSKTIAMVVAFRRLGLPVVGRGVKILAVAPGVPAGTVLHRGDVIVGIDGRPVCLTGDVSLALRNHHANEVVDVELATRRHVRVTLTDDPNTGRVLLGLRLSTVACRPSFRVVVDTGGLLGPSGGLAMTLSMLDRLSPGELLGKGPVAVTGTIDVDGSVGPVGGIKQKTIAARRAGAKLFIVPTDELPEARRHSGRLRVVGAGHLEDALRALADQGGAPLPPIATPQQQQRGPA